MIDDMWAALQRWVYRQEDDQSARCRPVSVPVIKLNTTASYYKTFTSPNPNLNAIICNGAGERVGSVCFAVSPLQDRVYVFGIEIDIPFRRQGYGMALLWFLASTYGVPITPIKVLHKAQRFWNTARDMHVPWLAITPEISSGEMEEESMRWRHLAPEIKRLDLQISERLQDGHESWATAVGRGLDEPFDSMAQNG